MDVFKPWKSPLYYLCAVATMCARYLKSSAPMEWMHLLVQRELRLSSIPLTENNITSFSPLLLYYPPFQNFLSTFSCSMCACGSWLFSLLMSISSLCFRTCSSPSPPGCDCALTFGPLDRCGGDISGGGGPGCSLSALGLAP